MSLQFMESCSRLRLATGFEIPEAREQDCKQGEVGESSEENSFDIRFNQEDYRG